jgi:phosphoserine phosphatase
MSKVFLVRHGETVNNVKRLYQGQTIDGELTPLGISQSTKVGDFLAGQNIGFLFSSPLGRAIKSSDLILAKIGNKNLQPIIIDCLKEISHGPLDGKNIDELRKIVPEIDPLSVNGMYKYFTPYPEGESFKDVFVRVDSFGQVVRNLNQNIVIVSHRIITPMIMAAILDLDPASVLDVLIDNDEIIEVDLESRKYNIIKF